MSLSRNGCFCGYPLLDLRGYTFPLHVLTHRWLMCSYINSHHTSWQLAELDLVRPLIKLSTYIRHSNRITILLCEAAVARKNAIAPIYFYVHHTMAMTKSVNSFCTSFHMIRRYRYNITASRCIAIVTTVIRVSVNCMCAYGRPYAPYSPYIAMPSHFHPTLGNPTQEYTELMYSNAIELHCEAEHTHMTENDSRPATQPKHDPKGSLLFKLVYSVTAGYDGTFRAARNLSLRMVARI